MYEFQVQALELEMCESLLSSTGTHKIHMNLYELDG